MADFVPVFSELRTIMLAAAGNVLANYDVSRGFSRAVTLSDGAALGLGTLTGSSVLASAFTAGAATLAPSYSYTAKLSAPGTLVLRAVDADGASSSGQAEGSTLLRSPRRATTCAGRA